MFFFQIFVGAFPTAAAAAAFPVGISAVVPTCQGVGGVKASSFASWMVSFLIQRSSGK